MSNRTQRTIKFTDEKVFKHNKIPNDLELISEAALLYFYFTYSISKKYIIYLFGLNVVFKCKVIPSNKVSKCLKKS